MIDGLKQALKLVEQRIDFCQSFNAIAQDETKFREAYICAYKEMKIYLEAAIYRVENGEPPDSYSVTMDSKKSEGKDG